MKRPYHRWRVGVLGGGQLARMLILKGHEMGLEMHVLCAHGDDPAAQVCPNWHQGDVHSASDLRRFLKAVDTATFESEFLNGELLRKLARETKTPIRPEPRTMSALQDRWPQKRLLEKYQLPTAPFVRVDNLEQAQQALGQFPSGMVLKKRRFGYDGYGTFVVRSERDLQSVPFAEASDGFIGEALIPFERELAIMIARNRRGEMAVFPLVETRQVESRCFWVKGPSHHKAEKSLTRKLKKFLEGISYEGIMAFELFDTGSQLLINEIAPRVHNSGHHSLDSLTEDQFSAHLKAVLNMDLRAPQMQQAGFAMVNLLGQKGVVPRWNLPAAVRLHWYGKKDNRKGRKMGHINASDETPEKALKKLLTAHKEFQL